MRVCIPQVRVPVLWAQRRSSKSWAAFPHPENCQGPLLGVRFFFLALARGRSLVAAFSLAPQIQTKPANDTPPLFLSSMDEGRGFDSADFRFLAVDQGKLPGLLGFCTCNRFDLPFLVCSNIKDSRSLPRANDRLIRSIYTYLLHLALLPK